MKINNTSIIVNAVINSISRRLYSNIHSNLVDSLSNMSRDQKLNDELKKARQKIKEKSSKYVPGTISLQVLGSGAQGAPKALYVFTDQSRYMFNVGEGSQRIAHEHKMKLSKLEHIFITQPIWENIGGLPGVALTIQEVGVSEITLHGPLGTEDIFAATRRFVVLKDLSVKMANCQKGSKFEDNVMAVSYVPLEPLQSGAEGMNGRENLMIDDNDDVDYYCHERRINGGSSKPAAHMLNPMPGATERISPIVMSYVCKLKTRPGTLNLEACVERGVPPGPLLGRLKNGEDITLPNGNIVKSADVTTPDDSGPLFIVVDCPNENYLDSLVNEPSFEENQENSLEEDLKAYAIVHFTPPAVINNQKYQNWINKFPKTTIHLFINDENVCAGSVAVHRIQHMLNLVQPDIFPLLKTTVGPNEEYSEEATRIKACSMASVHLRPRKGLDLSQKLILDPDSYVNDTFNTEEFRKELHSFTSEVQNLELNDKEYPKILFFGTGSCIPNKTRNTSAILVQLNETDFGLLDCGEGTLNQILRFYGIEESKRILSNLKMIYISHLHADHHIGLVGVLKGRRKLLGSDVKPLFLLAPKQIMYWLNFYHIRFEDILSEFQLVPNGDLSGGNGRILSVEAESMIESLNCDNIATVFVRHCPNAYGVTISHKDGWKLTYSGDTMPCQDLVALGHDCDILIHEATMEDDLEDEAKMKFHSTTSQAVSVAKAMNAKHTILTHFSQRYAKLPRLKDAFTDSIGIAFDNMLVSRNQLPILPKMYPALKIMFAEHCEDMEAKALRRNMRKEKRRSAPSSPLSGKKVCLQNTE